MHFKAILKEEINSLNVKDLHKKLNDINKDLIKGRVVMSQQQNPYDSKRGDFSKNNVKSPTYNMKKLRYAKALVTNRLLKLSGGYL